MALGHALQDVLEVGERLHIVEFCRGDEGTDGRPSLSATVGAGEQMVLAAQCNLAVILPMSGRMLWSDIAGIRCTDSGCVVFRASGAHRLRSHVAAASPISK